MGSCRGRGVKIALKAAEIAQERAKHFRADIQMQPDRQILSRRNESGHQLGAHSGPNLVAKKMVFSKRPICWWARQDSNLQPDRYERPALTIELQAPANADNGQAVARDGLHGVGRSGNAGGQRFTISDFPNFA